MTIFTDRKTVPAATTKRQQQGESSRELILDATERLMATRGYAATSISDIRKACGLPVSSIYWHFGSKEGVLAAVMERGAVRFFASIPNHGDTPASPGVDVQLATTAKLLAEHPEFLRHTGHTGRGPPENAPGRIPAWIHSRCGAASPRRAGTQTC